MPLTLTDEGPHERHKDHGQNVPAEQATLLHNNPEKEAHKMQRHICMCFHNPILQMAKLDWRKYLLDPINQLQNASPN